MNLQQDTCLQPIIGHSGSDSSQRLVDFIEDTLWFCRTGSVDRIIRIRSRTLMFGKNCDGHALSALTAIAHCAFSLVFIHFCDHNLDSPSTTVGMSKNAEYLLTATLI